MADSMDWYTSGFENSKSDYRVKDQEFVGEETDPISLSIPDEELVKIFDKNLKDSQDYYRKQGLYARRRRNELYLFGRQVEEMEKEGKMKEYEAKNLDNVLYEIEASLKPLAMSQLPDLIVTPGSNTDSSKEIAELLTTAVNSDVRRRDNRRTLGMAFKHHSVYYVGIVKAVWNPQLAGGMGDYEFPVIHPDNIDIDQMATSADSNKMRWISQVVHSTVQEVLMQFPKKQKEFIEQLKKDGIVAKSHTDPDWKALATPIDYHEVWFTEYRKKEDNEYERIEGVFWKYKEVILQKMKNPYYDYEGRKQVFTYENPQLASSKRLVSQQEMNAGLITGVYPKYVNEETVYYNFFDNPQKPFFFMVYDQWGKQPLDETTHLEQNIKNQDNLDKRAKQITETLNHRGHHIWSKEGGLNPSDVQKMDHNNPDEDYLVVGSPNQVHEFVPAERPTQQEFADLDRTRDRMYAISGSQAVRGEIQKDTTATNNQIAREGNYTRADDLVEETINPASEWMASWSLQFIKTRYTQEHFRKILGAKGETIFMSLHQNMIEDGMEVMIKSSGTDKLKRQNNAQLDARTGLSDPLTYFEDMDYPDAAERAAKIITFKTDMPLYLSEFVDKEGSATDELISKLLQITAMQGPQPGQMGPGNPGNPQNSPNPGSQVPGQVQNPSPQNPQAVAAMPPQGPPQASPRIL